MTGNDGGGRFGERLSVHPRHELTFLGWYDCMQRQCKKCHRCQTLRSKNKKFKFKRRQPAAAGLVLLFRPARSGPTAERAREEAGPGHSVSWERLESQHESRGGAEGGLGGGVSIGADDVTFERARLAISHASSSLLLLARFWRDSISTRAAELDDGPGKEFEAFL